MAKFIGEGDTWIDYLFNQTLEDMEAKEQIEWNSKVMAEYSKLKTDKGLAFENAILVGFFQVHMTAEQRGLMLEFIKTLKNAKEK